ncbi:GNAT family N-acetyltransferase [Alginatibacterium sediminis]|uniref:GNAT family N-acetyltransferase n=1 Tax=Alginatibacterium sediminis TaxID=2164068 RepID=A0A420EGU4_9ALTE|nr:GNAT family N-acetyltransferase [Alginatibacterium sediminis]RKF19776.1 GNAT family N-acetyltransferase [Alginatibacterium sediminis]
MFIRVAQKGDAHQISHLIKSLSHFYLNKPNTDLPSWLTDTLTKSAILKRIGSDEFSNFVCESSGEIIGYIAMKGNDYLYHLFVSKMHQGKGISRKLWRYATQICVSDVYTLRSSLFAVPVYKKFGFIEVGSAGEKDGIGFQLMTLQV